MRLTFTAIITDDVSILQTELSHREGHQTRRGGLEAMPLDQDIESRHGAREPGLERRPHAVHDLLEVEDECQHRAHRFHQDAVVPLPALTEFAVGGIAFCRMEVRVEA